MKYIITCATLLFSLSILSAYSETRSHQHYTSVEDLIKDQKQIRIVAVAVGGYGHLSATASMMAHLREKIGFQGTYEVIYPNMDMTKVATIFNLPAHLPDVYEDQKNNIRFIKLEEEIRRYQNNEIEPVLLGMSAAADDDDAICRWATIPLSKNDTTMCRNVAKLLNVNIYASVTHDPHNKNYAGSLFQQGDEFFLKDDNEKRYIVSEINTFFTSPIVTLDHVKKYIKDNPNLLIKDPALGEFIQGMENTLKEEASKPENDRVRDMIEKVVHINNGDKSALGNQPIDLPDWSPYQLKKK